MGDRYEEWLSRTDFKLHSLWEVQRDVICCIHVRIRGALEQSQPVSRLSVAVGTVSKAKESNLVWRCTYCSRIP
jgi:hypothetical protein